MLADRLAKDFNHQIRKSANYAAARAQQAGKLPTVGFLGTTTPSIKSQWTAAFVGRLRELGNIAIEYRWAEARSEHYGEIAAELVQSKVDVIVTTAPAFPAGDIGYPNCVCTSSSRPSSCWLRRELGTTRRERNRAFDALPRYCWQAT